MVWNYRLVVALLGLSAFGLSARADEAAPAVKLLQGTWSVESATQDGKPADVAGRVTISGDTITIPAKDGEQRFKFRVDPKAKPATMDFEFIGEVPKNAAPGRAIYELAGDTLKLCIGPPDRRPTEWRDKAAVLIVLKRAR